MMASPVDSRLMCIKDNLSTMLNHLQCPICLEVLRDPHSTRCGHTFCRQCITQSLSGSKSQPCPLCKSPVTRRSLTLDDKILNLLKGVHELISAVSKDAGFDVMQLTSIRRESTLEAFSPTERKCNPKENVTISPTPLPDSSVKVETWLKQATSSSLSQVSEHPGCPGNAEAEEETDSDFDSVSQLKPCTKSQASGSLITTKSASQVSTNSKAYQASDTIEDADHSFAVDNITPNTSIKLRCSTRNVVESKQKVGAGKIMDRKAFICNTNNINSSMEISQNTVISIGLEKENSTNLTTTRSPGWSRIKKMQMEFDESPKPILRVKNTSCVTPLSPIPVMEEPCISLTPSSPTLRTRETINKIVNNLEAEIEHYERESLMEKMSAKHTTQLDGSPAVRVMSSSCVKGVQMLPALSLKKDKVTKRDKAAPKVKFVKLGALAFSRSSKIPFLLKGRLMQLPIQDCSAQLSSCITEGISVHTQWSPQMDGGFHFNAPPSELVTSKRLLVGNQAPPEINNDLLDAETEALSQQAHQNPHRQILKRRSDGASSTTNTDLMDAETVIVSQNAQQESSRLGSQRKISETNTDFMDAETFVATQQNQPKRLSCSIIRRSDGAPPEVNTDFVHAETVVVNPLALQMSNKLPSLIRSDGSPMKVPDMNVKTSTLPGNVKPTTSFQPTNSSVVELEDDHASTVDKSQPLLTQIQSQTDFFISSDEEENVIEKPTKKTLLDLNDSSSSSHFNGEKMPKRARAISSDSSGSDDTDSNQPSKMLKKLKGMRKDTSFHENSLDLDISVLDNSSCTPDIEACIKANIEAGLRETERMPSPGWYNPVPTASGACSSPKRQESVLIEEMAVHTQVSKQQDESDGDSDIVCATQASSVNARDISQSDDIVPDSQPNELPKISCLPFHCLVKEKDTSKSMQDESKLSKAVESTVVHTSDFNDSSKLTTISKSAPESASGITSCKDSLPAARISEVPLDSSNSDSNCVNSAKKLSFICSNLPPSSVAEVHKLAQLVGAEILHKYSSNTTHLVVNVNSGNVADKTLKYLCTVAAGKWVVSFQWVFDSLKAGKLLPEEPYEAVDSSGEPGPFRSRRAHKDGVLLFKNFEFYCLCDFPGLPKAQMEDLLEKCGAVVVHDPSKFSFSDGVLPLSLAFYEDEKEEELLAWWNKHGSLLIEHDWVLDCVGRFRLSSLYSSVLCDTPDDLTSIGFPASLVEPTDSEQIESGH